MAAGGGQAVPLNRGGAATLRARECDPPPHVREHAVQFDQGVTAQWTGQVTLALQGAASRRSAASAHAPPWRAGRITDRTRARTPPRHVFEHAAVQFDQPDTVQFAGHVALAHASHLGPIPFAVSDIPNTQQPPQTLHFSRGQHRSGHVALAHGRAWASAGHALPLCAGGTATVRARALVPLLPHVREHAVQFDQAVTAQSRGHGCVAHGRVWFSGGHALPPNAGATTAGRARSKRPPPHERSHDADHAEKAPTTQSTGQRGSPHPRVSLSAGQGAPPFASRPTTALRLDRVPPPPHVREHCVQLAHGVTLQFTGQVSRTQASQGAPFGM